MSPMEKLIDEFVADFNGRHLLSLYEYEIAAKAVIKAQVQSARRSIGQRVRYAGRIGHQGS